MDVIITLIVAFVGFIVVILLTWGRKHSIHEGSASFTGQSVMHNFASSDRKAAIEEVQFVQEDSIEEAAGKDGHKIMFPDDESE